MKVVAKESIEEKLAKIIRMHGVKSNDSGTYKLNIRGMKIIVDGRIAEEYEDLPNFASCQIDYLAVDSDSVTPWFNMFTAFATHYPLMSNDKYNLGAVGSEIIEKIYNSLDEKYKKNSKDKERLQEVNRSSWLKIVREHSGLHHKLDCTFSCHDGSHFKEKITLFDLQQSILNSIDKTEAFFTRVQYPTDKHLFDSFYLAGQNGERWVRWNHIIPLVNKKINSLLSEKEFLSLLKKSPEEVLINGRLKNDPKKKIKPVATQKFTSHSRSWPDFGSHPNYDKLSWDERIAYSDKKEAEIKEKIKKLGHPRFEIIIPEENREFYNLQIQGIIWRKFDQHNVKNPEIVSFYNGDTNICLPGDETIVIDHLDKDKTPYLLGDLINLGKNDSKMFFIKIETPKGEKLIKFQSFYNDDLEDRDWNSDILSLKAKKINDQLKNKKKSFKVSERTGLSYLLHGYYVRPSIKSLREIFDVYR